MTGAVSAAGGDIRSLSVVNTPRRRPAAVARRLADRLARTPEPDAVRELQRRVAGLLGKEAALLLPTGKMAQQIALRVHADLRRRRAFAGHPTCHLANWEFEGYSAVHGLRFHALGDRHTLFAGADIEGVPEPLAAVVWELPQREIGGVLPDFGALREQIGTARAKGAAVHLDGARLWESAAGYGRSLDEIAALFDSVYVSLYKTLEVPRGAMLAGDREFVEQAWAWAVRLGGESGGNWPLGALGLMALEEIVPRTGRHLEHARALAAAIAATGVAEVVPDPPQTALFHVHLDLPPGPVAAAHAELVEETGLELFHALRTTDHPRRCFFELSVGEGAMDISPTEVAELVTTMTRRAADRASAIATAPERTCK
ncbi:threonine aldolase family protein [Streptomyces sp. NRRL F-5126]|uniref:threonine aldolase family protein n=1 Tax=Streptomyces sp. NRRL F-5126 TaxID=1463857 RepID=UPI00068F4D06|nr:beta-eliminating lyase-related protein [Streptomyces sp. NRRL F-5126]